MFNTWEVFDEKAYPRTDKKETFIYFLKRFKFLEEVTPLHSKAKASLETKILKQCLKNWLMPTETIREYYGDEVTIYFEWMNHFISKLS